jgi:hypothetical protein
MHYGQFEKHFDLPLSVDNMQITRIYIYSHVVKESALTGAHMTIFSVPRGTPSVGM